MKKLMAIILTVAMLLASISALSATAAEVTQENGIYYATNVTRAESGFDMQGGSKCAYFCANGLPITITDRTDGVSGSRITWEYGGETFMKDIPAAAVVCGGGWDAPAASASVTMTSGTILYGVFGGGVKETAVVGTADAPGTISVVITGGDFYDGIVGGGIRADVYGDISVVVGGESTVAENVIGGGFWGNVYGTTDVLLNGGSFGARVDATFICAAGVFGDVIGDVNIEIDGADVNGSVGGGSMICGNVEGNVTATMTSGVVTDIVGGGIGFYSNQFGGSTVTGDTLVTVDGGTVEDIVAGGALGIYDVCHIEGNTQVVINNGDIGGTSAGHTRNVFGGGVEGNVSGSTLVIINGGNMINEVVGGGCIGDVGGSAVVVVNDGTIAQGIIGGSETGSIGAAVSIQVAGGTVETGIIGGCETGDVTDDVIIQISGGNVGGDVVCGAYEGNVGGNVKIGVTDGEVAGEVKIGSIVSGSIATNEEAEVVVVVNNEAVQGGVTATENVPEDFNVEEDVIDSTTHTFGDWVLTTAPTCFALGVETRYCSIEFHTDFETRDVAMLPHTFDDNWVVTTAPTCHTLGVETRYCTVDGCTGSETRDIAMLSHTFSDWTSKTPASFFTAGVLQRTCTAEGCTACEQKEGEPSTSDKLLAFMASLFEAFLDVFSFIVGG